MRTKVGDFFEIFVLKSSVDKAYPGGASELIERMGFGEINNGLLTWGTMGQDQIINRVIEDLSRHSLNCDINDKNCVYVITQFRQPPEHARAWLAHENDEEGNTWLFLVH